eukprot:SAG31_NODE_1530_length_7993_cov_7.079807_3_plen_313_part_00
MRSLSISKREVSAQESLKVDNDDQSDKCFQDQNCAAPTHLGTTLASCLARTSRVSEASEEEEVTTDEEQDAEDQEHGQEKAVNKEVQEEWKREDKNNEPKKVYLQQCGTACSDEDTGNPQVWHHCALQYAQKQDHSQRKVFRLQKEQHLMQTHTSTDSSGDGSARKEKNPTWDHSEKRIKDTDDSDNDGASEVRGVVNKLEIYREETNCTQPEADDERCVRHLPLPGSMHEKRSDTRRQRDSRCDSQKQFANIRLGSCGGHNHVPCGSLPRSNDCTLQQSREQESIQSNFAQSVPEIDLRLDLRGGPARANE